jgi:hypothetical protein
MEAAAGRSAFAGVDGLDVGGVVKASVKNTCQCDFPDLEKFEFSLTLDKENPPNLFLGDLLSFYYNLVYLERVMEAVTGFETPAESGDFDASRCHASESSIRQPRASPRTHPTQLALYS